MAAAAAAVDAAATCRSCCGSSCSCMSRYRAHKPLSGRGSHCRTPRHAGCTSAAAPPIHPSLRIRQADSRDLPQTLDPRCSSQVDSLEAFRLTHNPVLRCLLTEAARCFVHPTPAR